MNKYTSAKQLNDTIDDIRRSIKRLKKKWGVK
jgi:hypothetical protein